MRMNSFRTWSRRLAHAFLPAAICSEFGAASSKWRCSSSCSVQRQHRFPWSGGWRVDTAALTSPYAISLQLHTNAVLLLDVLDELTLCTVSTTLDKWAEGCRTLGPKTFPFARISLAGGKLA